MNADSLLLGGDPPDVRVPASLRDLPWPLAAVIARGYALVKAEARRNGLQIPPEAAAPLEALVRRVSERAREHTRVETSSNDPGNRAITGPMTARQAAERLGCTPRRVRQLAGGLGGRLTDAGWVFDAAAIAAAADRRRAS